MTANDGAVSGRDYLESRLAALMEHITSMRAYIDSQIAAREQALNAFQEQVSMRFSAEQKAISAALASQERAVNVAENNAEKWRMNANEWRGAMDDRESKFVGKIEYELLRQRLDKAEQAIVASASRGQGMDTSWKFAIGLATLIAIGVSLYGAIT